VLFFLSSRVCCCSRLLRPGETHNLLCISPNPPQLSLLNLSGHGSLLTSIFLHGDNPPTHTHTRQHSPFHRLGSKPSTRQINKSKWPTKEPVTALEKKGRGGRKGEKERGLKEQQSEGSWLSDHRRKEPRWARCEDVKVNAQGWGSCAEGRRQRCDLDLQAHWRIYNTGKKYRCVGAGFEMAP